MTFEPTIYIDDIIAYYKSREPLFIVSNYLKKHKNIKTKIINFIIQIHYELKLQQQTLFLGVKLFDLFLTKYDTVIDTNKLYLVALVALHIARKYEENYIPLTTKYKCDIKYTRHTFTTVEKYMLRTLDFTIGVPTGYEYLQYYSTKLHIRKKTSLLAQYILETTLMYHKYTSYLPSQLVHACLTLAMLMTNAELTIFKPMISDLHQILCQLNSTLIKNKLTYVYMKYASDEFLHVSLIHTFRPRTLQKILKKYKKLST